MVFCMLISLEPYGRFKVHLNRCSVTAKLWVSIAVSLAQCLAGVTILIKPTILHVIQVLHAGNLGQTQVFSRVLFQFPSTVHSHSELLLSFQGTSAALRATLFTIRSCWKLSYL